MNATITLILIIASDLIISTKLVSVHLLITILVCTYY